MFRKLLDNGVGNIFLIAIVFSLFRIVDQLLISRIGNTIESRIAVLLIMLCITMFLMFGLLGLLLAIGSILLINAYGRKKRGSNN